MSLQSRARPDYRQVLIVVLVLLTVGATALGLVIFLGARALNSGIDEQLRVNTIAGPSGACTGELVSVAWLGDWLVVDYADTDAAEQLGAKYSKRLCKVRPDGTDWQPLDVRTGGLDCHKSSYADPSHLPDGRLSYNLRCNRDSETFVDEIYMMAYNMEDGKAVRLIEYPLPSQHIAPGSSGWNPEMSKGIASDRAGVSEQLYFFTPERWEPLPLLFSRAIDPVWSPDGRTIAFWGAPEQGLSGIGKANSLFNLYLMDPDGGNVRPLARDFVYPWAMSWSPDSRWIAFAAASKGTADRRIWLVDADTGTARLLSNGRFQGVAWSPDGQQLAAIKKQKGEDLGTLVMVDLSAVDWFTEK